MGLLVDYTGRVTVPILWDKKTNTIVSNESSEIIRMFNSAFDEVGALAGNFVPAELLQEIDDINTFVYSTINNGVYKTGFSVYVGHFKCNLRRIVDYPNLWGYLRDLYQVPGIADTVNMDHIKQHYYTSHANINPTRIVPAGPVLDFNEPHDRARLQFYFNRVTA